MEQYTEAGFVSEASEEYDGALTYVSHHSVIRPDKLTTPMRKVFNGSAGFNGGPSLNDWLHVGKNLLGGAQTVEEVARLVGQAKPSKKKVKEKKMKMFWLIGTHLLID